MAFKSFVILDLESTGLPSCGKPKITEISLLGVLLNHILETKKSNRSVPRVIQKLSLNFYPRKVIDFEATEITGLDNFLLEYLPAFDAEACDLITSFLTRMPPPVCLIAHNGHQFDFPLLKAELSSKLKVLPADLTCADSLLAFRVLLPIGYGSITPLNSTNTTTESATSSSICMQENSESSLVKSLNEGSCGDVQQISSNPYLVQKMNETTPKRVKAVSPYPPPIERKCINNYFDRKFNSRKCLFQRDIKLVSHKLSDIYCYLHGKAQDNSHRAETDCLALLECIVSTAPEFLSWVERNHINFSKIPCMW